MESVIEKIVKMEKDAQEMIAKADLEHAHIDEEIQKEGQQIESALKRRMDKKIADIKETEEGEAEQRIADIKAKTDIGVKNLKKMYEDNKKKWEDGLFERIFQE